MDAGVTNPTETQQPLPTIANRAACLIWKELLKPTNGVLISGVS